MTNITVPRATWDALREALKEAATSLETISRLAGRTHYVGDDGERVETYMGHHDQVRGYATSRASVARQALTAVASVSHPKPETAPPPEGGAITSESDHFPDATKMMHPLGWYCVSRDGLATQCADQRDAEITAKSANRDWPNSAPYRAVQLCEFEAHPQATESAWMPIETAPKDGTWVLAINAKTNPTRQYVVRYFDDAGIYPWKTRSGHMDWVAGLTHWLPLPAAPEAKQ